MRIFLDTSVLIAAFYETHPHHEPSLRTLERATRTKSYCAAHSLAETYSVMTRMPGNRRIPGEQVLLFLGDVQGRVNLVGLEPHEYFSVIERAAAVGVMGGALYDFLLAHCALKAGCDRILTWNLRNFVLFGTDIARKAKVPG